MRMSSERSQQEHCRQDSTVSLQQAGRTHDDSNKRTTRGRSGTRPEIRQLGIPEQDFRGGPSAYPQQSWSRPYSAIDKRIILKMIRTCRQARRIFHRRHCHCWKHQEINQNVRSIRRIVHSTPKAHSSIICQSASDCPRHSTDDPRESSTRMIQKAELIS
jgi:hypothetical protein